MNNSMEARASSSPRRIDEVDSLRAFAMTSVIAQHCKILPFGWMGVWLFFVISGFVVTKSLLSSGAGRGPTQILKSFYARRAARIWPIYLGYVVIGFAVCALAAKQLNWPALASLVLFYNNFQAAFAHGIFDGFPVGHLWTISVEFQFYIVFGLAFALLPRRGLVGLLIAFLVLSPLLRFIGGDVLAGMGFAPLRAAFAIYSFSPMHFDSFAVGALLALGQQRWMQGPRAHALFAAGVAAMAAYAAFYVALNHSHGARGLASLRNVVSGILFGHQREIWLYSALALLSAGVLAVTLSARAPWAAVTRSPLLQAVGRVSYGGYVYHVLCIQGTAMLLRLAIAPGAGMARKLEFGVLHFALALPLTITAALLSYRYVEQPIIRWARGPFAAPPASADPSLAAGEASS
jgi:peptidoglycan/LPS O-acetylase OafA/YrhL